MKGTECNFFFHKDLFFVWGTVWLLLNFFLNEGNLFFSLCESKCQKKCYFPWGTEWIWKKNFCRIFFLSVWGQIVKNIYTYFQGLYLCLRNWVKDLFFLWKLFFFPWPHTALSLLSCEEMSKVFFFIRTFFLSHKEKKIQVEFFFCFCVRNHMIFFFSWGKPFFSVCGEKNFNRRNIFKRFFFLFLC